MAAVVTAAEMAVVETAAALGAVRVVVVMVEDLAAVETEVAATER